MKRPAFQFYPADWRKDPALCVCSLAARGLWIELMCIAHEADEYGYLVVNGMPMTHQQIARLVGESPATIKRLMAELEDAGVYSVDERGVIYSRRMVEDERVRNARAEGGKAGAEHGIKGASHGKKGGRPHKSKEGISDEEKTPLKTPLAPGSKPPPSSSSSSSTSYIPPIPPAVAVGTGGRPSAVTFRAWQKAIRESGEKAIPEDDPVFVYAEQAGISLDLVRLAWVEFRNRYSESDKRYRDWRKVFRNAVRGNWFRLWYATDDGEYALTTQGMQAQRCEAKEAA